MKYLWIVFFIFVAPSLAAAHDAGQTLAFIARSHIEPENLALTSADKKWLEHKKTLRIGVSAPDYPPFDITTHNNEFEGITADYAGLVGDYLNVDIQIISYPDRAELISALKHQDIDLVGTANEYEAVIPDISLSPPYSFDNPVFVASINNSFPDPTLSGKKVSMLYHYLPLETVKRLYPNTTFILYSSILKAISSVNSGETDYYLGDTVSANYLVNKNYLAHLKSVASSPLQVNGFSFAMLRSDIRLQRLISAALNAIPASERLNIWRRWEAGGTSVSDTEQVKFTVEELRWLQQNPLLKVGTIKSYIPFTFTDENGDFKGLSADVLAKISLRTGLQFKVQEVSSVSHMIEQLQAGEFDLLAALTPSNQRKTQLDFTRPYLSPPLVLVTPAKSDAPNNLQALSGKTLAVVQGNTQLIMLAKDFPDIHVLIVQSLNDAFAMVANGRADATLSSLLSAHYIIASMYSDTLKVTSTVSDTGNQISFAVNKSNPQLLSILNKSLLSVSPQEMDEVSNRWRRAVMLNESYWGRYGSTIVKVVFAVLALLLGAFAWITLLRNEVFKRKQAERALSDKLEFERALLNGTPHPIYARDRNAALLLCNKAYMDILGIDDDTSLKGTTVIESQLSDPIQALEYHENYLKIMDSGEPVFEDRELRLASGKKLTVYHWTLPYRGSDGLVKGLIGGWLDISERQCLMQQLHSAKLEADNASRAKTIFLATMSHEIRTPMNAVIGLLEMASKSAEQGVFDRVAVDVASDAARGLLDLIGDILDIARIESGQLSLTLEQENPKDLILSTMRIFSGPATQKSLKLQANIDASVDCDVLIDRMRFKQVLANLLSNAIKFTAHGSIQVWASATRQANQKTVTLEVRIQDDGIGIDAVDQQRLFRPFTQIDNPQKTPEKGAGLGLVICRTLMEMMDGTLELSSEPSKGTLVTLKVNLALLAESELTASPSEPFPLQKAPGASALNILIVDDVLANRIVLTRQLSYLGHEISEASNGQQALEQWNDTPFDVIITDCNMPIMDGYALAKRIRQLEKERNEPACLLLGFTANAVPQEHQRCLEAGMDDCLFKPISLSTLNARLQALQRANDQHDDGQVLSTERLQERLMLLTHNDRQVVQSLWAELQHSHHTNLLTLQTLIEQRDRQGLSNLAHLIKGGARIIQYEELIVCCENLEAVCQSHDLGNLLESTGQALKTCMLHLSALLQDNPSKASL